MGRFTYALPILGTDNATYDTSDRVRRVEREECDEDYAACCTWRPFLKCKASSEGDAEVNESELVRKLARVELVPSLGWEDDTMDPEGVVPRIMERLTSAAVAQGKVVFGDAKARVAIDVAFRFTIILRVGCVSACLRHGYSPGKLHVIEDFYIGRESGGTRLFEKR
ncbi:hypothetical protein Moror_12845 [Moniliophthora roreri MCA 2997]|uniref:Uncharacterized protein n=1 Tax=Moniliophthora roreri (strain MCA 2997) TaxID=1381753 RepID=V2XNL7_MONRO|nr:hypothetical protein Moror_12845 [Moniliophthora roreri MCA 2997]